MGDVTGSASVRDGFWERMLPRSERADALWAAGFAAAVGVARVVVYQPVTRAVPTALWPIAAWAIVVGVATWALMRFSAAPRATVLFFLLTTVVRTVLLAGNHAASAALGQLVAPGIARSPLLNRTTLLVTLAELLGVLAGAWLARLSDPARLAEEPAGIASAIGWQGRPWTGAARLAVMWTATLAVVQLANALLELGPNAFQSWAFLQQAAGPRNVSQALGLALFAVEVTVFFLAGYLGVKRFSAPTSVWLAFIAVAVGTYIASLMFLPSQFAVIAVGGGLALRSLVPIIAVTLGIGLVSLGTPALGVWLASGQRRVSDTSATLPAEEDDHERAGGTDG